MKVEVKTERWQIGTGRKSPSGVGYWCFGNKAGEIITTEFGAYSVAKKEAMKKAANSGYSIIYLLA